VKRPGSVPYVALAFLILIWGYSWVAMKVGLAYSHPFDFAALRIGIGAVFLFAIVIFQRRPLKLAGYRTAFMLGSLQVALFVSLSHFALLVAGPGKVSVLVFTMPFWMILFASVLLRDRMRGSQWAAVALAFAGLMLIVEPWKVASLHGSLLAIAAGAVWAFSAVLSKKWPTPGDPLLLTAWQLLFGFGWLLALSLLHPHPPVHWTGEFVAALVFAAVLGTAMGWWIWTYVLARTSAAVAGLNSLGIPVVAVVSSAIQLGERPPPSELAGMLLIGTALALLAWINQTRQ
jgi:drug/metabolite transporter (DMT)-like permease